MEEILQILIFVGAMVIAVIGQNAKNKKKPMTASPQEVLEDMFPDIEIVQETNAVEPPPTPLKSSFKRKKSQTLAKPPAPQTSVSSASKKEKKISLSNRSEAKRAFIYSEIFNRKY